MSRVIRTEDGSNTLFSERYRQSFHSTNGAVTEVKHVFIEPTGVRERLEQCKPTQILEIGFGLGLNALLCADLAQQHKTALRFQSFEHDLVSSDVFEQLNYAQLLSFPELAGDMSRGLCELHQSVFRVGEYTEIVLLQFDVSTVDINYVCGAGFNAVFMDAFSPDTNAECWSQSVIDQLAGVLSEKGVLSTYSAKGDVRRALLHAGLHVEKLEGPPGKREMLRAIRV